MLRNLALTISIVAVTLMVSEGRPTAVAFAASKQTRTTKWMAPIIATSAAAGILLTSTLALAGEPNLQTGAVLFQANCAGCHAGGMNFMSAKKTLQKEALEKYQSLDQAQIQKFVQQGMPHKLLPFSKTLSDQDYFDATSFVLDQALNDKW